MNYLTHLVITGAWFSVCVDDQFLMLAEGLPGSLFWS